MPSKKTTDSSENLRRYVETLERLGRANLKAPAKEPTIMELCAEGMKLLEAEEKNSRPVVTPPPPKKDDQKKLETALGKSSSNPYIRARAMILEGMNEFNRKRIEELEKSGETEHPLYKEFVALQIRLGDKLSS